MKALTRSQLGLSNKVTQNKITTEQPTAITKKNIISTWDEWRATSEFQAKRQEIIDLTREKVFAENSAKTNAEKDALTHQVTKEALNLFRKEQKLLFESQLSR